MRPATPASRSIAARYAWPSLPSDRHPGDEVVDDEVVQHDDAGAAAQRVDDPAVRVRVVADVVERDVGVADRPRATGAHDLDVDEPLERRDQQCGVVGDPARRGRQRREVRDLHSTAASRRSMHASHVTALRELADRPGRACAPRLRARAATCMRARAPRRSARRRARSRGRGRCRAGRRRRSSVITGFSREERLVRDEPVVLVDRRVVDAEAARVEIGELLVADAAGERRTPVEAAVARERLQPLAVRPVAGDHDADAGRLRPPPRSAGRSASRGRAG